MYKIVDKNKNILLQCITADNDSLINNFNYGTHFI